MFDTYAPPLSPPFQEMFDTYAPPLSPPFQEMFDTYAPPLSPPFQGGLGGSEISHSESQMVSSHNTPSPDFSA
jgi:hypothetical protein